VKIAYLLNQYPRISTAWMRREILAMEEIGVPIERFALRETVDELVDEADVREKARTRAILDEGAVALLGATLAAAATRPIAFGKALRAAVGMGRRSERGMIVNLIYLAEACVFLRWMIEGRFTHVHVHFATNPAAVAMLCRIMGGPPYSFTMHGPEEFDSPRALSLAEKIRHADFVVAITEFTRSQLYRWSDHADWGKIRIVRCGVDAMFLGAEPTPVPPVPRLVNVGRVVEQKGQLLLIEAAARVIGEGVDCEVVIVGDGPMRGEAERLIGRLGLAGKVRITGYRSGSEVRREIQEARALVLPSFAEGLPVVIFEALALGRPVISTYIAGIPELVEPGECGWLVPAGSVDALARAMREALTAPAEELDRMGREGGRRVAEFHDSRVEAARLASWFDHDPDRTPAPVLAPTLG
jgi:colanic acid/amylovoran biosynthesis glycosyltransferase